MGSKEEKAEFSGNSIPLHLSEHSIEVVAELEIVLNYCLYAEHSCHKLQINRKYCLHPFEAKRVQILYISSHIKECFYIERENFE